MNPAREQHFGSDSVWRDPPRFLADFRHDLRICPELGWQLFLRNLRARYRQSFIGYAWAVVPPLAWAALFVFLRSAGQMRDGEPGAYIPYVIAGVVFWQLLIESAQIPLRVFAEARPLLAKLVFPRESLIVAAVLEVGLQLLIRMPLLLLAWFMEPASHAHAWILLPVGLAGIVFSGLAVGLAILPIGMLYQDVSSALTLACGFGILITPVGYMAPETGWIATFTNWNPAAILIDASRGWWLGSPPSDATAFVLISTGAVVSCVVSWSVARVAFPHLVARFGS